MDGDSCRSGKRGQAASVRLPAGLLAALYVLGWSYRRHCVPHREPWYGSTHRATLAGGARTKAVCYGAHFEWRSDFPPVRIVPDGGGDAVGLLSRALGSFRKA